MNMGSIHQSIKKGFSGILFPKVCVCCGLETTEVERDICTFCLEEQFEETEPAGRFQTSNTVLPEGVKRQIALWKFDKGGKLQTLLHYLKYERLTGIGMQLGRKLGLKTRPFVIPGNEIDALIVPVPLHYLKYRYRGFNQAFEIAKGVQEVFDRPICSIGEVIRSKNTKTQTGLTLKKRAENVQSAFKVKNREVMTGRRIIIVDDVFTTGATTFELSRCLIDAGARETVIITVAQA